MYNYTPAKNFLAALDIPSKEKSILKREFDYAMEIGADRFSLVRAMYVG